MCGVFARLTREPHHSSHLIGRYSTSTATSWIGLRTPATLVPHPFRWMAIRTPECQRGGSYSDDATSLRSGNRGTDKACKLLGLSADETLAMMKWLEYADYDTGEPYKPKTRLARASSRTITSWIAASVVTSRFRSGFA